MDHINHGNSKLSFIPDCLEFGNEVRYNIKIMEELSVIYARIKNQQKFRYQTVFSARFDEQKEDNQVLDETELFNNLNVNHNLTESDIIEIDIKSPLEHEIQRQEMKDSGWRFDKINSLTVYFDKTGELYGAIYVKITMRSNAILNVENNDKFCFLWSILAYIHPCNNNHPNRVSTYIQCFNELNIQRFDFHNGFKSSDDHKFNELNSLFIDMYELNFYQDQNKWRHNIVPIEVSKNDSEGVIDLLFNKFHYALIEKINVFSGNHHKFFICRRCLNSYTRENMLLLHKPKCENNGITTTRVSNESHI